jgi:hypothetical protein
MSGKDDAMQTPVQSTNYMPPRVLKMDKMMKGTGSWDCSPTGSSPSSPVGGGADCEDGKSATFICEGNGGSASDCFWYGGTADTYTP